MKKLFALTLAALMLFSVGAFADTTPSEWAADEVGTLLPGMFESLELSLDYQAPIRRDEFAMLAFTVYNELSGGTTGVSATQIFEDLQGGPLDMFVALSYALGIVKGVSETEFVPAASLTRQELCTMLYRVFEQTGDVAQSEESALSAFQDKGEIAEWALDAVEYCAANGYIVGMSETTIAPLETVSAEQAIVICNRIISAAKADAASDSEQAVLDGENTTAPESGEGTEDDNE